MVFAAAASWLGLGTAYPGDEARFIETSRLFGNGFSLNLLTHYEEMSTPLPFMYYGLWGKLFGYELATMRIGALVLTLASVTALHGLLYLCLPTPRSVTGIFALTLLNPYFVTMGVFVYTDMPAILFGLLACIGLIRRRWWMLLAGVAGALLCRQYMVYMVGAIGIWLLIEWVLSKRRDTIWLLAAVVLGVAPMAGLVVLWAGPSPDNELKQLYLQYPTRYHLTALTLYVSLLSIYLLPMVLALAPRLLRERRLILGCLPASLVYLWMPVRPSACAVDAGYSTVGLFDRALVAIGANLIVRDAVFWIGFACGLLLLGTVIRDMIRRVMTRSVDPVLLMGLCVLTFLLIMPLSYLSWEKYFLPVLPMACVAVWMADTERRAQVNHPGTTVMVS